MAIMDASLHQNWIAAFDKYDRAKRRFDAAGAIGNASLTGYVGQQLEAARVELNAATKAINNS